MGMHTDDFVETLVSCSTHDMLLFFTNTGKVYRSKGYEIPEYGRAAKGIPAINLLGIDSNERIQAIINVTGQTEDGHYLFFTTRKGTVKRTDVTEFANIRSNGLKAIVLNEGDELIRVALTNGSKNIIIGTHEGYAVSFEETDVRSMGRSARGVRGIRLREDDYVVGMDILEESSEVLVITEKGYGKRTSADEYSIRGRGGKGVKTANITEKNGNLAGLVTVQGDEDIMLITNKGVIIRMSVDGISQTSRSTLGVRLIRVADDVIVSTMAKVEPEVEEPAPIVDPEDIGEISENAENESVVEAEPIEQKNQNENQEN